MEMVHYVSFHNSVVFPKKNRYKFYSFFQTFLLFLDKLGDNMLGIAAVVLVSSTSGEFI
jgi:hypothetical protein